MVSVWACTALTTLPPRVQREGVQTVPSKKEMELQRSAIVNTRDTAGLRGSAAMRKAAEELEGYCSTND
jgi:hypothetical protein